MPRQLRAGQRTEIYLLNPTTGEKSLRYATESILIEAPNWSPDGQWLAVNGDGHLFLLGVESGDLEPVDLGDVPDINNDHVLSPDGATVYVSADDGHIYAVALTDTGAGPRIRRVTHDHGPNFRHYLHGVSPDGRLLAYIGMEILADAVRTNIYTIPVTGGADVQLTDDDFPDDGAEFSPDGRWIYFNSERASTTPGHAQLFRIPAAGGPIEQLTDDERVNWFPHPAPDGRSLVYVSFPPGTIGHPADQDVIVRLREENGTVRDLDHVFGGQGTINVPSWAPDGSRIAYVAYPLN